MSNLENLYYVTQAVADSSMPGAGAGRPGFLARTAGAVFRGHAAFRRWRRRRAVVRELTRLPDRTLADIGLHRGAIPEAAESIVRWEEETGRVAGRQAAPPHAAELKLAGCS